MKIKQAQTPGEIAAVRLLFREYEAFLGVDLCFQNFEDELASLPGKYAPPDGGLLIALSKDNTLGCVAMRRMDAETCEMKRLFVKPEARGTGLGKQLAQEIIALARERDYSVMRLDTLDRLAEAMCLYEAIGFRQTDPYYDNPLPGVVYWELELNRMGSGQQGCSTVSSEGAPSEEP